MADPFIIGSAISAGAKLLGGLFGDDEQGVDIDSMRQIEQQRYKWLVKGAQDAGFNPLTALRATGGQMAQPIMHTSNPLSVRNLVSQAVSDIGSDIGQRYMDFDPVEEETKKLRLENQRKLGQLYDNERQRFGATTPKRVTTTSPRKHRFLNPAHTYPNEGNPNTMDPFDTDRPVVDPTHTRPEMARVTHGPAKGRYVISFNGLHYLTPPGTSPQAMYEELSGSAIGEATSLAAFVNEMGGQQVWINDEGELILSKPPKSPGFRRNQRFQEDNEDVLTAPAA